MCNVIILQWGAMRCNGNGNVLRTALHRHRTSTRSPCSTLHVMTVHHITVCTPRRAARAVHYVSLYYITVCTPRRAARVEARARAVGGVGVARRREALRAAVRLSRRLEPEVGVDEARVTAPRALLLSCEEIRSVCAVPSLAHLESAVALVGSCPTPAPRMLHQSAQSARSSSRPRRTPTMRVDSGVLGCGGSHSSCDGRRATSPRTTHLDAVAPRVDDDVLGLARRVRERVLQLARVVELVVRAVVLAEQAARVGAARVARVALDDVMRCMRRKYNAMLSRVGAARVARVAWMMTQSRGSSSSLSMNRLRSRR